MNATEPIDCKLVVLTHYLPPYIARYFVHLSRQIRELQILLSIDQEPNRDFGDTWEGLDVTVQKSWMFRRPWKHRLGFTDELYIHVPLDTGRRLRAANPDVVLSYELGFRSLASAIYCKRFRKPLALCVCVSEHTEQGRGRARNWLRRILLRSAAAVTYNGPSCKSYLQTQFSVPDDKLFHVPYCTSDLLRFEHPIDRSPENDFRLLCISQLNERKGVLPLLEMLDEYCRQRPQQRVDLQIIGGGSLESTVRQFPCSSNLQLKVFGHVPYYEISNHMAQTGILVFPTLADEWGMVVNEAMQAGMPVLGSSYAQACTTLIEEGTNGWLYQPDSGPSLNAQLDKIFATSRTSLQRMRTAAQSTVADITPQHVAGQAAHMVRSVISGRNNAN